MNALIVFLIGLGLEFDIGLWLNLIHIRYFKEL